MRTKEEIKKVPEVEGVSLKEAKEILEKANIEIEKEKKKFNIFEKSGKVIKVEPKEKTKLKKNEKVVLYVNDRRPILVIILLFLLCALFMMFRSGTISTLINTTAPVIESKTHEWSQSVLVNVKKDATMKNTLDHYEYCVTSRKNTIGCVWRKTTTKNTIVSKTGKWYVYFRGIDEKNNKSRVSNREYVLVDNESPVIKEIEVKNGKVTIDAKDRHSGIDKIYYSYDGENYIEASKSFDIDKSTKIIYIKIVDKAGNEIILSKNVDDSTSCDLNCDTNNDGKCDLNCDTDNDGKCDLNCDTDNDGKCDLNCDTDNDGKCDLNCDTDNDGKCDLNCTNNATTTKSTTTKASSTTTTELIDNKVPIINLNKVPSKFIYGSKYDLPSYYKFGPKGGKVKCIVDGKDEKTDTSDLGIGKHNIVCTAYGNNGINVRVSKMVEVDVPEGEEEEWDGWIRLNLYYPANSTNWQWRIGKDGEIRDGYDFTGWQDYTGPILVKLEDVKNVYIRYNLLGETYVIAPSGKVAVDIEPSEYTILKGEKTKVKIYYEKDALTKEYRVGASDWMEYTGEFEVEANTLIEARSTKEERVYNSDGEYLYSKKIKGNDSVFISELLAPPGVSINPSDKKYTGTIEGGYTEEGNSESSGKYGPTERADGSYTTIPDVDFKPSEYLDGPIISGSPSSTLTDKVKIQVTTKDEAEAIYVQVGYGSYFEYTGEFEVTSNTTIYAYYVRKSDGMISRRSYYRVKNIKYGYRPYVRIDTTPDYLSSNANEVIAKISGSDYDTLEYSFDGYIYQKYTGEIKVTSSCTIYARGTNSYGATVEKEYITTKNAPTSKKNLTIEIFADPVKSNKLVNKTRISIDYDINAEKKYYKLAGESEYKEYTGPFEIDENTTIYAYATSKNAVGYKDKGIDFLTTGIMAPIITVKPTTNTSMVKVTIEFDQNASQKYYQIDNGEKLYYTGEFEIYKNSNIYAYNANTLGYEASSSKEITNVNKNLRYYVIDKGKYYIIKLNYPSGASVREYKWKADGTWKNYDDIGILLIKPEYKDEFNLDGYDGIKVQDEYGKDVIFTDHYYLIDVPFSKLMENLFMRWDRTKPSAPDIMIEPEDETSREVKVIINYSKTLEKKYYKLVNEGGQSTGWMEYTGPFNVSKNGVIVYAKGETYTQVESDISSRKITNIDNTAPDIIVNGDLDSPKQKINLFIRVEDKSVIDRIKYAKGNKNVDYFKNNGSVIDNFSTITIEENDEYTFYAIDELGNAGVKIINVTNIDKDAPNIVINVEAKSKTIETKVTIDYGDSKVKLYKIGENGEYKEYTDKLILKSSDLFNLKNEDGSLTIYAKGIDEALNESIVKEITYVLDLDEIKSPVINVSDGYPMLTRDGMIEEKQSYISYDTKDDIENYYKIDDGKYVLYNGSITIKSGKITARSERKLSGQVVEVSANVVVPANSIGKNAYDGDLQTSETIARGVSKLFTINPNLYGEKLKIYTGVSVSNTSTIKLYDKDKKLLNEIPTVAVLTIANIEDGTYYVEINSGSGTLDVREISLQNENFINDLHTPIISISESGWAAEKVATVKYYSDEYKNEYSLDNGSTWLDYQDPIKLIEPTNVIARTIRDEKVIGSSNFIVTKIDTEEPVIELNIGNKIQLGYDKNIPTYYKETPSGTNVECRDGNEVVTNTSELKLGKHSIVCTATTGVGRKVSVEKKIEIVEAHDFESDSILAAIADKDIITGKYKIQVNDEVYSVHVVTYDENQHFTENQTFGDAKDVATADDYAQNMVIVKINGDLEIDSGVTVAPYYDETYGGPKGFMLYVTGKLTNNGTIDNSHGAYAEGQNVYLWKNTDGSYEYVPAEGAVGNSIAGVGRMTGSGGGGSAYGGTPGSGGSGTSYSGGTGGGASHHGSASSGAAFGGAGGYGSTSNCTFACGGGAGNPGGAGACGPNGANGTGGLLIIYSDTYINKGIVSSHGYSGGIGGSVGEGGGGSGGGSINIFINQNTVLNQEDSTLSTDTHYYEILGNHDKNGGAASSGYGYGGAGGTGTITIGEIRNKKYYDLTDIIEQDKEKYIESVTIKGESILSILNDNSLNSGYYYFAVNNETYPVHIYTLSGNQHFTENQTFGDAKDVATSEDYAQNMVIVKVNGDLEIDSGVTVAPYYDATYGGPKGFTLYVTGKLTNNGTIDNSHGAKAEGQNVYLWKNTDGSYEYVPAEGAVGNSVAGVGRMTGSGGRGSAYGGSPGSGGPGTSYSGGPGGGASHHGGASSGAAFGGAGGYGSTSNCTFGCGGGAGNPGGAGVCGSNGSNGTGGLLIIYSNSYVNNGTISSHGYSGGYGGPVGEVGGGSGGGSINIFTMQLINSLGNYLKNGGGSGGAGTITYTQLQPVSFTFNYTTPNLTESKFEKEKINIIINYLSTLTKKLYSLDNGTTWLEYKGSFDVEANTKILAKGIKADKTETDVVTYEAQTQNGIPYETIDENEETKAVLEANKEYVFTIEEKLKNRKIRFYLENEASNDASIKVYDKNSTELLSTTFVNNLTVINIPEESYKFVITGGSENLEISEINLKERIEVNKNIPEIKINDTNWTSSKTIEISYSEGYKNEYSLDLGENWIEYEEPIVIEEEKIILARSLEDDKVVGSSSYVITSVDNVEPTIEMDIPDEVTQNDSYEIPTKSTFGKSEGTVICKVNDKEIKNTNELEDGENTITCIATSGSGKTTEISKTITLVKVSSLKDTIMSREIITTEPTLTTSSNNTEDVSGLYKSTETNSGEPTYYFRGDVQDNYVSFAGQTWRIVRINEDGTIRLIMQDGINNNQAYAFNLKYDDYSYMYYSNSEAKTALENWYNTNIENNETYSKQVATGAYFCEQAKVKYNSNYTSGAATMTVYTSYTPNFKCETDGNGKGIVNSNIGLITYDEAVYAGGYFLQSNNNYYLYTTPSLSWTMSPSGVYDYISNVGDIAIYFSGDIGDHYISYDHDSTGKYPNILRPVINLKSDAQISGLGTIDDPYVVK